MMVVDGRSRRIIVANDALAWLVGRPPDSLAGTSFSALDLGKDSEMAEYLVLALAVGDQTPRRRTLRGAHDVEIPVDVQGAPLGVGRGAAVLLTFRDARDDAAQEAERGRLQAQLWMAQKHESVGKLAAGLAHDFSNLLSVVMLTSDGLRERFDDDPEVRAELDLITDAGFRARELTMELLAFTGQQVMAPRPVSLNQLVVGLEPLLRRAIPENVELALRMCDESTTVNADPNQIQQVLLNLVMNAQEAMPEGGHVMISTQEVEIDDDFAERFASVQAGPHVLLSVSDTGIGMDEETRERIFDPFYSTRERGRGSGLGLATVYGIVKQSGGSIWVTSEPGAGSNFRIYLPRIAAAPRRTVDRRGVRVGGVPGGSEHVLLVEDDALVRDMTARILEELGYRVTRAATPDDAALIHDDLWPLRGAHPVDLMLTDVIMPGMSGVELARRIRTKREDLPVLYMSGYLTSQDNTAPGDDGHHLAKPFTRAELARSVRAVLDRAGRTAAG